MAESVESTRPRILTLSKQATQTDGWSPTKTRPPGPVTPIKKGPLRVDQFGETSYKKTPSDILRQSIQLGLHVAIGSLAPKAKRDLLMTDFEVVESVNYPSDGSDTSPAHKFPDFKFNTYSPNAFRFFREAFGIQPDDFMLGLCDQPLIELSNPGASGSLFYLSGNDEFIIKTVQKKETEFLQKLLPGYYLNLTQNKQTLLPKFFGLFKYQSGRSNIRLVVMNNLLPRNFTYHQKFDLKGSTYKRQSSPEERDKKNPTFKDLDLLQMHPEGFTLTAEHYESVRDTITRDSKVLESFSIMDYSLLLAVHYKPEAPRAEMEASLDQSLALESLPVPGNQGQTGEDNVRRRRATFSILYRDGQRHHVVKRREQPDEREDEPPEGEEADNLLLGGIPARTSDGRKVLVFMGIIDILQSYRLKKKLEHTLKAIYADGATVSVCNPHYYAQRFVEFMMNQVFKKGKAKPKLRRPSVSRNNRKQGPSAAVPHVTSGPTSLPSSIGVAAHTQDRQQYREEDHHGAVPPTYREVLEKDERDKLKQSNADAGSESDSAGLKREPADKPGAVSVQAATSSGKGGREGERDVESPTVDGGAGHHAAADVEGVVASAQLVSAADGEEVDQVQPVEGSKTIKEGETPRIEVTAAAEEQDGLAGLQLQAREEEGGEEVTGSSGQLQGGEAENKHSAAAESVGVTDAESIEIAFSEVESNSEVASQSGSVDEVESREVAIKDQTGVVGDSGEGNSSK